MEGEIVVVMVIIGVLGQSSKSPHPPTLHIPFPRLFILSLLQN